MDKVPDWPGVLFLIGAVVLVYPWLYPCRWKRTQSIIAAVSVIVPYWMYGLWLTTTSGWAFRGASGDMLLIPILVAFTFGRRTGYDSWATDEDAP